MRVLICLAMLLVACVKAPTTSFETTIRYGGETYVIREERGTQDRTILFEINGDQKRRLLERPGLAIHFTADQMIAGLPSYDARIATAVASDDSLGALLYRVVRDGERLGEAVVREG